MKKKINFSQAEPKFPSVGGVARSAGVVYKRSDKNFDRKFCMGGGKPPRPRASRASTPPTEGNFCSATPPRPLVLCILDGVGHRRFPFGNAVRGMPYFDLLKKNFPWRTLAASGAAVGLPPGTMGNSEVGHITLGAGRTVNQFLRRFQIENLEQNKPFADFVESVPASGAIHIVGLCSDGRVHSDIGHAIALARIILKRHKKIIWHFVADGRDTDAKSALRYVRMIRRGVGGDAVFGSLAGRYYTMDRDNNLERTRLGFDVIAGKTTAASRSSIEDEIRKSYAAGVLDEHIRPIRFAANENGVGADDGVLFFNYRADRARQFLHMLLESGTRRILCLSQYGGGLDEQCPAMLPNIPIENTLGDTLAAAGLSQLRLAETEKYNHVTYFFDAERTMDYKGGRKILVPSLKVASFDLRPEMSAEEITNRFLENAKDFDMIIMNYANGDMVGHTGNAAATMTAMKTVDDALSRIVPATLELGGTILVTADHGNAERMRDWRGRPWKAHTTSPVPFIVVSNRRYEFKDAPTAGLANIAPTMLKMLGLSPPPEMSEPLI